MCCNIRVFWERTVVNKRMNQIFLITAYKESDYLYEMARTMSERGIGIYIHWDKKSVTEDILTKLNSIKNVKAISKYKVPWGGYQHVQVILYLLKMAYEENEKFDYVHVLTGQDCLCGSVERLVSFFDKDNTKNYMSLSDANAGNTFRYRTYYRNDWINYKSCIGKFCTKAFYILQKAVGVNRRTPNNYKVYKGMVYVSIKREFAEYVLHFLDTPEGKIFSEWIKWCFIPEEFFFQTIIMNSPYKDTVCNNNYRYALWEKKHGTQPGILDMNDYENIIESKAFFARKMDWNISKELIKKLDLD